MASQPRPCNMTCQPGNARTHRLRQACVGPPKRNAKTEGRACIVAAALLALTGVAPAAEPPRRIVSLIPAVTEILFAVGAGPRVVGVSSFDRFPPEVARVTRVGALLDPDLERIISLKPDLVAIFDSQADLRAQLARAGIPLFVYSHSGLPDVLRTIRQVGDRVGAGDRAAQVAGRIDDRLAVIRRAVAARPRPATLIVLGREPGALRGIYVSGGVGFIHDMVAAAGGDNVFADVRQQGLQVSTELILTRRPEVVLELRGGDAGPGRPQQDSGPWKALASLPAVRSGRIVLLQDDRTVVPGPRIAEGVELIARALHPGAFR